MLHNFFIVAWRSFKKNALYSAINVMGLSVGLASAILIMLSAQIR